MGGFLINFEGIDRAGKGNHTALLAKSLAESGLKVATLHFPVLETAVGRLIADYLAGRVSFPPETVQMLYSANRYEMREKVLSLAREVDALILDRYCPSGWAYGMALGLSREWLQNLDAGLPKADLTILLDLPPEVAAARRLAAGKDVLERDVSFQAGVGEAYRQLAGQGGWAVVDVRGEKAQVHREVLAAVRRVMPGEIAGRET